jgi:hypothetical protein
MSSGFSQQQRADGKSLELRSTGTRGRLSPRDHL